MSIKISLYDRVNDKYEEYCLRPLKEVSYEVSDQITLVDAYGNLIPGTSKYDTYSLWFKYWADRKYPVYIKEM